uniref:Uncharacterized protein n=1 Tax=Erythrocystis saccata TaxID=2822695 RepID=A0A8E6NXE4_9FLOR|nr:hypothetical protein [Erythrocystis saccata]
MNNNNFFLRYVKGEWFLQENLFLFKSQIQINNEVYTNFDKVYNSCVNKNLIITNNQFQSSIIISKNIQKNNKKYVNNIFLKNFTTKYYLKYLFHLEFIRKGLLRSKKFYLYQKILQDEYIYLINSNIMITITLVKNLKNKYLGVKISSYIKKKKQIFNSQ